MKTIVIMGMGLMGSSLGLALKQRGAPVEVRAFARRAETCDAALKLGAADAVFTDPVEAVSEADLVVFCVPILTIPDLTEVCLDALKSGAVLTDVGSTKSELNLSMHRLLSDRDACFIGSHPICGSEKTGVEAGVASLYDGRLTVVCAPDDAPDGAVEAVSNLWKTVGSEVTTMSVDQHDAMLASTSHLPHMVAAALARSVAGGSPEAKADFCGTGFKDTTRVASGSADMWVDIIDTNRAALEEELNRFHGELEGLIDILRSGNGEDIRDWLEEAAAVRNQMLTLNRFLKS